MLLSNSLAWAIAFTFTTLTCHAQTQPFRNVMYIDEWHANITSDPTVVASVTHVIVAFVDPKNFTTTGYSFDPPHGLTGTQVRQLFSNPELQVGIALGGWGPFSTSFSLASTPENQPTVASNLAAWMKKNDYNFVDIDWEYPGGGGVGTPINAQAEIDNFPTFLKSIKDELVKQNVNRQGISLALAGTKEGMAAFQTVKQTQPIWENIDFITVMAYDLVNRASNFTGHHTDVESSKLAVQRYIDLGLTPDKINLGFAFYAKYFQTNGSCADSTLPIGCPIMKAQYDNGTDTYTSGVLTFEYNNMVDRPVPSESLLVSPYGLCGSNNGTYTDFRCGADNCCSEAGWCGNSIEYCVPNCQIGYGICNGPDVAKSFKSALANPNNDTESGGAWYLDTNTTPNLFWTWETTDLMWRKFDEIVNNKTCTLGGISAWSLGEDSFNWEHVKKMKDIGKPTKPSSKVSIGRELPHQWSLSHSPRIIKKQTGEWYCYLQIDWPTRI
ncbi:carbohydrate-binding module family 18 protein [Xylariaceae sp. AK1471]|nr:carbohydrate-binding module family 18 protein [Xylariaceae sp. AK1471]